MKPLTKELIEKHSMTYYDALRYFNPHWSDDECEYYLWEKTCYPFSVEILIKQLNKEFYEKV